MHILPFNINKYTTFLPLLFIYELVINAKSYLSYLHVHYISNYPYKKIIINHAF